MPFWVEFQQALGRLEAAASDAVIELGFWTYVIFFLAIFLKTALIYVPFIPTTTLVFSAGLLSQSEPAHLNIWAITAVLILAAIAGDNVSYWISRIIGPKILTGRRMQRFTGDKLDRARRYMERNAIVSIVFARWIAVLRSMIPVICGVSRAHFGRFLSLNSIGAVLWVLPLVLSGYWLGNQLWVRERLGVAVGIVAGLVLLAILGEVARTCFRRSKQANICAPNVVHNG
jgi:membrane-associated protein